jgi:capsular exopolysaccharide synthesis family protein
MSRIHDALRKAAEEKAAPIPLADTANIGTVTPPSHGVVPLNQIAIEPVEELRSASNDPRVRFEDLVRQASAQEWKGHPEFELSGLGENGRVGAEGFRTLRSRLYQLADTRPLRRILVTSSLPAEGKTFVAAHLAQSIVQQPGRRVLLIDADLRSPALHSTLGAPSTLGLTDYLRGDSDERSIIQKNPVNDLCLISSGSQVSNPSELLLNDRMKTLLDRLTPAFHWVILDSPPTLLVHDPSRLADLTDGVLFVVRAGATTDESARKACLEFREKKLLGVVLNQVDKTEMQDLYHYGSKYN